MAEQLPILKRRSFTTETVQQETTVEPIVRGEHSAFPWTSAASWFIKFVAWGWILEAIFSVIIGIDAVSTARNTQEMLGFAFKMSGYFFLYVTVAFCLLSVSELSILLAKYVTRNDQKVP